MSRGMTRGFMHPPSVATASSAAASKFPVGPFTHNNIAASSTTVFAFRSNVSNGGNRYWQPNYAGEIVALSMDLSNAASPDQLAVGSAIGMEVVVNGTGTGSLLSIAVGQSRNQVVLGSPVAFPANAQIGVRFLTDGSWTGNTLEVTGDLTAQFT